MRTERSNRWLNVLLLAALVVALYLNFSYQDEDLQEYYHSQQMQVPAAIVPGSISAR